MKRLPFLHGLGLALAAALLLPAQPVGATDLLWRNAASGGLTVWLMDGTAHVADYAVDLPQYPGPEWSMAATGDLDGDGGADVVWRQATSGTVVVWFMDGARRIGGAPVEATTYPDAGWHLAGTGDFNSDGRADLLWRNQISGVVVVWLMNGIARVGGGPVTAASFPDANWAIAGTGDFNRDGETDILWRNGVSGNLVVWFMSGTTRTGGGFVASPDVPDTSWNVAGTGDFNRDGAIDILWRQESADQARLWLMDGTTRTSVSAPFTVPGQGFSVLVGGYRPSGPVAAGDRHSGLLTSPGTAWTWGGNDYGQLGDGTQTPRRSPVPVPDLLGLRSLAAGAHHSLALKDDGTLWGWGDNARGQLGPEVPASGTLVPVPLTSPSGVTAIACGDDFSVVRLADGSVWTWGANDAGQLGHSGNEDDPLPAPVAGLSDARGIAAGARHALAVRRDGTVWSWGSNSNGQLGHSGDKPTPGAVPNLGQVAAVAAGDAHSLAVRRDGTVWAWGDNGKGQLGDGTTTGRYVPAPVLSLTGAEAVRARADHSLALKSNGMVWGWGENGAGQLGDGSTTSRLVPVRTGTFSGAVALGAGRGHGLALSADGVVWAWGDNTDGQIGDGTGLARLSPVAISDPGLVWNAPPVADAGGPYHWTAGEAIRFDGSASSDPDGDIATYSWSFGDGTNGDAATLDHVYSAAGTYSASLIVTDANGVATTDTAAVTVVPLPPTSKVVWTSLVGASASTNTLTKTGTTTAWDAGGVSRQVVTAGDTLVQFVAETTSTDRVCGLGNGDSGPTAQDVEYGLLLSGGGTVQVTESGTVVGSAGAYAAGDRFRVSAESGVVRYLQNGRWDPLESTCRHASLSIL